MPIPDSGAYRPMKFVAPPGVTEKQAKQDQLAALYGVTMPQEILSETEVATMRRLLAQHDGQSKPVTTTDLNNPPRIPYRFQKFPMMVYDHMNSHPSRDEQRQRELVTGGSVKETVHVLAKVVSAIVNSEEELQDALAAGWVEAAPNFTEEREEPLSAAYANEAARIQARIDANKTPPDPLAKLGKAELIVLAKDMGIDIDGRSSRETILEALKAA